MSQFALFYSKGPNFFSCFCNLPMLWDFFMLCFFIMPFSILWNVFHSMELFSYPVDMVGSVSEHYINFSFALNPLFNSSIYCQLLMLSNRPSNLKISLFFITLFICSLITRKIKKSTISIEIYLKKQRSTEYLYNLINKQNNNHLKSRCFWKCYKFQ